MKSVILLAALTTCLAGNIAYAADPNFEDSQSVASNWSGAYIGVLGTASLSHYDVYEPNILDGVDSNDWGPTVGGFAGYNWQSGNIVYGVEGEVGYRFGQYDFDNVPGPGDFEIETGLYGKLKARIGFDQGIWMPYIAAGVTAADLDTDPGGFAERSATLFGGVVGLGADIAVSDNIFVRASYEYSFFSTKRLEYCGGCLLDNKVDAHDFMIGAAVKF